MIIPYFRKEETTPSSWFPPKWDEEDLAGNYHLVNSSELSLAWCTQLPSYGKFFMGRRGVVGTCVVSITAEINLEGALETMWSHLVRQTGPVPFPSGNPQTLLPQGNSCQIWKAIQNSKVILNCLLSRLVPFLWCIKSKFGLNRQCKSPFNLSPISETVKGNVRTFTCTQNVSLTWNGRSPGSVSLVYVIQM